MDEIITRQRYFAYFRRNLDKRYGYPVKGIFWGNWKFACLIYVNACINCKYENGRWTYNEMDEDFRRDIIISHDLLLIDTESKEDTNKFQIMEL